MWCCRISGPVVCCRVVALGWREVFVAGLLHWVGGWCLLQGCCTGLESLVFVAGLASVVL